MIPADIQDTINGALVYTLMMMAARPSDFQDDNRHKVKAALAWLEQQAAPEWEPVPDGEYKNGLTVKTLQNGTVGIVTRCGDSLGTINVHHWLPLDIRLCRQRPQSAHASAPGPDKEAGNE